MSTACGAVCFRCPVIFLFEFRNEIGADPHLVQTLFHLARLLVVHCGAQLVVRHKAVIRGTEAVEHVPVFRAVMAAEIDDKLFDGTRDRRNDGLGIFLQAVFYEAI